MCRDHRCLTACQKQHRQNEPAGQVDVSTGRCRDHRCLMTCQKQHRQNEPAGQVDVSTRVEVSVMRDPGHVLGPQMSHRLSKNNTDRMN